MDDSIKARIADGAPAIMAFHDLDQNIQWANDAYCKATGLERRKIEGMKCWEAWGLSGMCRGCPVVTAIETGQSAEAELTPKNQDHWPESQGSWLSKATPVRGSDGEVMGVIEAAFDISGMVAAKREAEEQTSYLDERVKELECLIRLSEAKQECVDLDELLKRAVELIPPAWHYPEITVARIRFDGTDASCGDIAAAVSVQSADIVVDGEARGQVEVGYLEERESLDGGPFLKQERNLIDAIGRMLAIGIGRLERGKAIAEAESRFRIAQDMSPDGFTILQPVRDESGEVVDFEWVYENSAVARLNGTDPEAVVGKRLPDLFPGHRSTRFFSAYQRVAETGEPFTFEDCYSGESMPRQTWFRIVVVPMIGDIAILSQDITERKQAEEDIQAANQQLRASNQQLRATEQQLRASNQQLRATEQQLRASNQQLRATEQQLRASNQQLTASKSALELSEREYRTLVEGSLQGVVIAQDGPVRLRFANTAMESISGYGVEELLSMGAPELAELIHADDRVQFFDSFKRRVAGETVPPVAEYRIIRKDGATTWVLCYSSAIDYLGEPATLTTFVDITERKQAEEELQAATQQLRATEQRLRQQEKREGVLLDHSPVCHKVVDLDFNLQYMSASGYRMLKLEETNEHYGKPYPFDFFPEQARKKLHDALVKVKETKRILTFDSQASDAEGNAVWLHHSVIPVLKGDGAVEYITVVSADITQRKQAEHELRRFEWLNDKEQADYVLSEGAYAPPYGDVTALNTCRVIADAVDAETLADMGRDLMDLLDTSVAVYEANGDYAFGMFDSRWCRLLDSASFARCKTDDTREALHCGAWLCHENCWNDSAKAAIRSGEPTDIECVGGVRLNAAPILAGGDAVGAVNIGYGTPPTDGAELSALAERFEVPLDEVRMAAQAYKPRPRFIIEVAKRRCRTVARMIGEAVEKSRLEAQLAQSDRLSSMGTLAAGVAHEINNPLAYTLYNIETVVEELPAIFSDYRKAMTSPSAGSDASDSTPVLARGSAQLDDLLECAREALEGAQRIRSISRTLGTFSRVDESEEAPIDIRYAAEQARNMARNETKFRAKLQLDLEPVPMVIGSEGKMAQVFLNLLINAAHAIDEGDAEGNSIRIRTYEDGDQVVAEVSDTGKGIPTENLELLFEPFFTTKPIGVGSGLGLSISKKIITEMGGEISCESQEGRGTTFRIRLPAMPGEQSKERSDEASPEPAVSNAQGRILVVDDEPGIRTSISRLLGREGHEVATAASGAEAKEILIEDQAFDLIVLDLMMPKVSGMDLHRWLADTYPELAERVIFVTGGVFTPRTRAYLSEVENMRLEKPIDTAKFKKVVEELIGARGR